MSKPDTMVEAANCIHCQEIHWHLKLHGIVIVVKKQQLTPEITIVRNILKQLTPKITLILNI